MDNRFRNGFFTSSQASRLIGFESRKMTPEEKKDHLKDNPKSRKQNIEIDGFSKPAYTYIEEVFIEKIIKRAIDTEVKTRPIKWGALMEIVLFNLLSTEWTMTHKQTTVHPKYKDFWSGTPDFIAVDKIAEAKCFQPKKFTQLSLCLLKNDINTLKKEFKEEYWQCVSNCAITGKKRAVLIAFMPYRSQLEEIIEKIESTNFLERNGLEPTDYYFMSRDEIETMAYLDDDSDFSNINSMEFEIPKEDLKFIESRMIEANKKLQKLIKESKNELNLRS